MKNTVEIGENAISAFSEFSKAFFCTLIKTMGLYGKGLILYHTCRLLTTIGKKPFENIVGKGESAKVLVTSIFYIFHNVFFSIKEKLHQLSHIEMVVYEYFQFIKMLTSRKELGEVKHYFKVGFQENYSEQCIMLSVFTGTRPSIIPLGQTFRHGSVNGINSYFANHYTNTLPSRIGKVYFSSSDISKHDKVFPCNLKVFNSIFKIYFIYTMMTSAPINPFLSFIYWHSAQYSFQATGCFPTYM